jgi:N-acylneuraminate cytidylyltransferase
MKIAFIPARGGSKRLPRKNLRSLGGYPLIAHSIAAAKSCARIDRCVVSTDDDEIAAVAEAYGATVIQRPKELATDVATTGSVAAHLLERLADEGVTPEVIVTLQPTCPLRPRSLIETALDLFAEGPVDSVVSVTRTSQKLGLIEDGWFVPTYPVGIRSQDMRHAYFENGLIYVSRGDVVSRTGNLFGERVRPLIVEPLYAMVDIDTDLDFSIAEFLYARHRERFTDMTRPSIQAGPLESSSINHGM